MNFPMSLRWTVYIVRKPQRVSKTQNDSLSSKIWTIICDNFETAQDKMSININHCLEVAYGPSIGTDIGDLEGLNNSPYFALFHWIW